MIVILKLKIGDLRISRYFSCEIFVRMEQEIVTNKTHFLYDVSMVLEDYPSCSARKHFISAKQRSFYIVELLDMLRHFCLLYHVFQCILCQLSSVLVLAEVLDFICL